MALLRQGDDARLLALRALDLHARRGVALLLSERVEAEIDALRSRDPLARRLDAAREDRDEVAALLAFRRRDPFTENRVSTCSDRGPAAVPEHDIADPIAERLTFPGRSLRRERAREALVAQGLIRQSFADPGVVRGERDEAVDARHHVLDGVADRRVLPRDRDVLQARAPRAALLDCLAELRVATRPGDVGATRRALRRLVDLRAQRHVVHDRSDSLEAVVLRARADDARAKTRLARRHRASFIAIVDLRATVEPLALLEARRGIDLLIGALARAGREDDGEHESDGALHLAILDELRRLPRRGAGVGAGRPSGARPKSCRCSAVGGRP